MLDEEEVGLAGQGGAKRPRARSALLGRADGESGTVRLSLWSQPYKESHHPRYTPLVKVPDVEIRNAGRKRFADSRGDASWLEPDKDSSAESLQSDAL